MHFEELKKEEKEMLATLWRGQLRTFGAFSVQRFAYYAPPSNYRFEDFVYGYRLLLEKGFVHQNKRKLVGLTDIGMDFCRTNEKKIFEVRYFLGPQDFKDADAKHVQEQGWCIRF